MTHDDVQRWLDGYVAAWRSYDEAAIGDLFSEDASYRYDPVGAALEGRAAIVADWLKEQDEAGSWQAEYSPLLVEGDRAVAAGRTTYANGRVYENLYVLRFAPDGRCSEFTEWYWRHPGESETQA